MLETRDISMYNGQVFGPQVIQICRQKCPKIVPALLQVLWARAHLVAKGYDHNRV